MRTSTAPGRTDESSFWRLVSKVPLFMPTIFLVFFALLGSAMSFNVWVAWSLRDGFSAKGTVIDKGIYGSQDVRGGTDVNYVIYYEYHHDGWPYRGQAYVNANTYERIELGSSVPVVYHRDAPDRSRPGKAPLGIPLFPAAVAAVADIAALGLLATIVGALRRGGRFLDSK